MNLKLTSWWFACSVLAAGKKKQLHVGKPGDDLEVDSYDALDDYDFM
jgi:hypothetical protein